MVQNRGQHTFSGKDQVVNSVYFESIWSLSQLLNPAFAVEAATQKQVSVPAFQQNLIHKQTLGRMGP